MYGNPDYIMENSVISDLTNILNELEYYKSKKDLIRLITRLDNLINNNNKDLIKDVINGFITKIEKAELDEGTLKTIEKVIYGFFLRNEKQYIKKMTSDEWTLYEYRDYYTIYINKPMNIHKLLEEKFNGLAIISAHLDHVKWKNIKNIAEEDIKQAKIIKIEVAKIKKQ